MLNKKMQYITPLDLKSKLEAKEKVVVIDIRDKYELEICKMNAIHIPMSELTSRVGELHADAFSVIVCRSGKRAEAAANLLSQEYDFNNIFVLEGGILAWIDKIEPNLEAY